MLTPSEARSLVQYLQPFNPGQSNWRIAYNFRKDTYTPEARSSLEVVGALNFPTYAVALAATMPLKHATVFDSPLIEHPFDYGVDSYEYNPNVDNYSILRCAYTNVYTLSVTRGVAVVGAYCFPKNVAIEIVSKLNRGVIVL